MSNIKLVWGGIMVAIVFAIGGFFLPQVQLPEFSPEDALGATGTRFPNGIAVGSSASVSSTGTFNVGSTGNGISKMIQGSCTATQAEAAATAFAASSTRAWICSVTGARSGDKIFASLDSGSNLFGTGQTFSIVGTRATTTDQITIDVLNIGSATSSIDSDYRLIDYFIVD